MGGSPKTKGQVFIHCQHGKDRTGLLAALYRVKYQGWTPEQAHKEWAALGHSGMLDTLFTGKMDNYFWKASAAASPKTDWYAC